MWDEEVLAASHISDSHFKPSVPHLSPLPCPRKGSHGPHMEQFNSEDQANGVEDGKGKEEGESQLRQGTENTLSGY